MPKALPLYTVRVNRCEDCPFCSPWHEGVEEFTCDHYDCHTQDKAVNPSGVVPSWCPLRERETIVTLNEAEAEAEAKVA